MITTISELARSPEILLGIFGPLFAAVVMLIVLERSFSRSAERVTQAIMAAMPLKMLFFGAYVLVMIRVLELRPVPFVLSFAVSFAVFQMIIALRLKRFFV